MAEHQSLDSILTSRWWGGPLEGETAPFIRILTVGDRQAQEGIQMLGSLRKLDHFHALVFPDFLATYVQSTPLCFLETQGISPVTFLILFPIFLLHHKLGHIQLQRMRKPSSNNTENLWAAVAKKIHKVFAFR